MANIPLFTETVIQVQFKVFSKKIPTEIYCALAEYISTNLKWKLVLDIYQLNTDTFFPWFCSH